MSSVKVQKITEPLTLGEAPHWDDRRQVLFFVDIPSKTIHKYDPATEKHTKTKLDGRVGFILPVDGETDQFLVGVERKFLVVRWDGAEGSEATVLRELATVEHDKPNNRINDGKADPTGRLYAGSLGYDTSGNFIHNHGSLYCYDGKLMTLVEGVTISNGLAWDLKEKAFYYTDSMEYKIRRYDYDVKTGAISNPKHIFDLKANNIPGMPDGTTIDTEGNLWVAVFAGFCVLNIDPRTGKLLRKVDIPAKQVTSVTFGGPDLDVLFVTTASKTMDDGEVQKPPCGSTFMVTGLGVKGHPNVSVKL